MSRDDATLRWIDAQRERMSSLVRARASINSHSENPAGLARMHEAVREAFAPLGETRSVALPAWSRVDDRGVAAEAAGGQALVVRGSAATGPRVLLAVHTDTVHAADGPFQRCTDPDGSRLVGPGVVDAKGGIAVMLVALEAFARSPWADRLRWEVILNPDEELGSPASIGLLRERAAAHDLGLLFEPALDEAGALAGARGGSGVFTVVVHGRSAHVGRAFEDGRSAIVALAHAVREIHALNGVHDGVTLNVGRVVAGDSVNRVPDLAVAHVNARIDEPAHEAWVLERLHAIVAELERRDGIRAELSGRFHAPPKPLDASTRVLLGQIGECGRELGLVLGWRTTRGVCDGNKLAAAGLPNVDTLGPRGGGLHTSDEYVLLESLTERAKLVSRYLAKLASGELTAPPRIVLAAEDAPCS